MKTFRIGGVHPAENKLSAGKAIETLALPKQAVFPLSQHIGAPATAIVKKGDVVCIIEAMKLMNEIESEYDGIVEAVLVNNEEVVEYGQPLFRIK